MFHLKRTRTKGTLHDDQYTFSFIFRPILLRMKKSQTKVVLYRNSENTFYVQ